MTERYTILAKIGTKETQAIYRAIDTHSGQELVLKYAGPHELRIVQALTGYDFVCGSDFYTMPFYQGGTLRSYIQGLEKRDFVKLWPLYSQLLEAVDHVHQQGIIHRDIKPGNIVLDKAQLKCSLIDFGIAYNFNDAAHMPPSYIGSAGYLAPECILTSAMGDFRSDVYSLGAVLLFMLTGKDPYKNPIASKTLAAQLSVASPLLAKIDAPLQKIIAKAMAIKADERYCCVAELQADLYLHS